MCLGGSRSLESISLSRRRLQSSTSPQGDVFARDVTFRERSEVGGRSRGHINFNGVILTSKDVKIRIHQRYSSFVALRTQLAMEAPGLSTELPRLPSNDVLHKYSVQYLEWPRLALDGWLQAVMLNSRWRGRAAMREWLVGTP